MSDRVIAFEGIHNFRDYGGYALAGGGQLPRGLLFRSAQHRDASDDDLARLQTIGLANVTDLRGSGERANHPCRRHAEFAARVFFVSGDTTSAAVHIEAGKGVRTPEEAFERLKASYSNMPFRPRLIEVFRAYFDAIEANEGPSLVHCLAGKDRTGLIVALLHHLVGVHADDAMADYLLTNDAGDMDKRINAGRDVVKSGFGPSMMDDAVRVLMSVHPDYLHTAFGEIIKAHGSIEQYAHDVLGVDEARRQRLVALLTVS